MSTAKNSPFLKKPLTSSSSSSSSSSFSSPITKKVEPLVSSKKRKSENDDMKKVVTEEEEASNTKKVSVSKRSKVDTVPASSSSSSKPKEEKQTSFPKKLKQDQEEEKPQKGKQAPSKVISSPEASQEDEQEVQEEEEQEEIVQEEEVEEEVVQEEEDEEAVQEEEQEEEEVVQEEEQEEEVVQEEEQEEEQEEVVQEKEQEEETSQVVPQEEEQEETSQMVQEEEKDLKPTKVLTKRHNSSPVSLPKKKKTIKNDESSEDEVVFKVRKSPSHTLLILYKDPEHSDFFSYPIENELIRPYRSDFPFFQPKNLSDGQHVKEGQPIDMKLHNIHFVEAPKDASKIDPSMPSLLCINVDCRTADNKPVMNKKQPTKVASKPLHIHAHDVRLASGLRFFAAKNGKKGGKYKLGFTDYRQEHVTIDKYLHERVSTEGQQFYGDCFSTAGVKLSFFVRDRKQREDGKEEMIPMDQRQVGLNVKVDPKQTETFAVEGSDEPVTACLPIMTVRNKNGQVLYRHSQWPDEQKKWLKEDAQSGRRNISVSDLYRLLGSDAIVDLKYEVRTLGYGSGINRIVLYADVSEVTILKKAPVICYQ